MKALVGVWMACVLFAGVAYSDADDAPQIQGLLELPELAPASGQAAFAQKTESIFYREPTGASQDRTAVNLHDDLWLKEITEERPAAVVFEVKDDWYCLAMASPREGDCVWKKEVHAEHFKPLIALLNGMAYLTPEWDGRLYESSGSAKTIPHPQESQRHLAGVVDLERGEKITENTNTLRPYSLRLHEQPQEASPILQTVYSDRPEAAICQIDDMKRSLAPSPIAVIDRKGDWYKVHVMGPYSCGESKRMGWIHPAKTAATFREFFTEKERRDTIEAVYGPIETSVHVKSTQPIEGVLWAQIDIIQGVCSEKEPHRLGSAWVPVNPPGRPAAIWFHSRGC